MRIRDPDAKRDALISAGLAVADEHGLGQLSVNRVVALAGVAKGSFFHHFGDRAAFLTELHRRFHDRLPPHLHAAPADLPPGRYRLTTGPTPSPHASLRGLGHSRALALGAAEAACST